MNAGDHSVWAVMDTTGAAMSAAVATLANIRLGSKAVNVVQQDTSWILGEYSRDQ